MKLTRRGFFSFLTLPAAALLVPARTIFLPPACGWGGQPLARIHVPYSHIVNGFYLWDPNDKRRTYDMKTETVSLWEMTTDDVPISAQPYPDYRDLRRIDNALRANPAADAPMTLDSNGRLVNSFGRFDLTRC